MSEPFRIRSCSFYVGGAKIGTAESGTYKITSNDEDLLTAEGWSSSDGQTTTELTVETIVPVDGQTKKFVAAIFEKKYLQVQIGVVDGEVHAIKMRCVSAEYKADNKAGSLKGTFSFKGGEPTRS